MMATTSRAAEKITYLLPNLKVDSHSGIGDSIGVHPGPDISSQDVSLEPPVVAVAGTANNTPVTYEAGMEAGMYYAVNGFVMPHGYYYGGLECDWDDYLRQIGADGVEFQNVGAYNEHGAIVYHPAAYGYGLQNPYGPYTPGASIPGGQFYGAQGYPYAGHIYPQPVPPTAPSSAPIAIESKTSARESPTDGPTSTSVGGNNGPSGTRPGYIMQSSGPYGLNSGSQDVRVGFERPWLDSSKEVQQRHGLSLPASVLGQGARPVTPLMPRIPTGQLHGPSPGAVATPGALARAFPPSARTYPGSISSGRAAQLLGTNSLEPGGNGRNWIAVDKGKAWGRGNGMVSGLSSSMDILNEQNRGPRTTRIRNQRMAPGAVRYIRRQGVTNVSLEHANTLASKSHYNRPDFATNYDNAKFFIIKSYSEDDIHKSIKYSVWASTVNGNKKLDAAYQEAQASSGYCPLFLLFSVNASGQFCGVAEMIGPVDFNKTLDFWLQDKWTGKFPVMWHIVKDVPNHQFRHIILENNENKPVTNSRDTQEVRFDQGLEMLNIFKNFVYKTSIVDDFQFYENRQKAMQEKRARQQVHVQHQQVVYRGSRELETKVSLEAVPNMLHQGMQPVENIEQREKSEKPKDGHVSSLVSEKCNGIDADVTPEKHLARSDSRGSSQVGVADRKLALKQTVSASLKSSGEVLGKK